jgi:hypothetical protein
MKIRETSLPDSLSNSLRGNLWGSLRDSLVRPVQAAASKRPSK